MALKLTRFRLHLEPTPGTPSDLTVMPADRMRAERLSTTELPPSQRGPNAMATHPETWVLLWLWCAAKRTGLTEAGFESFADTVAHYDRLDAAGNVVTSDDDAEEAHEPVDPTRPGEPTG